MSSMLKLRPFRSQACGRKKEHKATDTYKGKGHATSIQVNQASQTMPRQRSAISIPKGINNTKPLRCAKVNIMSRALRCFVMYL